MRKAIEVLIQYIGLHSDALCPCLDEKDRVVTISRMLSGKRVRTRQALDLAVAMFYRIIKTFLDDAWQPQKLLYARRARTPGIPQRPLNEIEGMLGCAPELGFSAVNETDDIPGERVSSDCVTVERKLVAERQREYGQTRHYVSDGCGKKARKHPRGVDWTSRWAK